MQLLSPENWKDYELIDSGNFEKLERFGSQILTRPEPQAIWKKSLAEGEWSNLSNAKYTRKKGKDSQNIEFGDKGQWQLGKGTKEQWFVNYKLGENLIKFRLGLTSFGHIGVFPEQASNWEFIYSSIKSLKSNDAKVLNLFAYTGGASLAAKVAGADVSHVDSVKQVITWSKENMEASSLKDIRWIIEDALKYVKREVKREKKYNGIILDPPAYGRGPDGEKWILEENLPELLSCCNDLLSDNNSFLILNLYSMGFSSTVAKNLVSTFFNQKENIEYGELQLNDKFNKALPLGVFARFRK
ncbi:MAG: class I SAM-dependent methyltransferase [Bacteroidota bacterium]